MRALALWVLIAFHAVSATVTMRLQTSTNLSEWTETGISTTLEINDDNLVQYFRAITEIDMANSRKYEIELKTESTDAVPSALSGTKYWYDTGTTENGEKVYYDNATGSYAYWNDGTDWLISAVADVGGSPTDYFKEDYTQGFLGSIDVYIDSEFYRTVAYSNEAGNHPRFFDGVAQLQYNQNSPPEDPDKWDYQDVEGRLFSFTVTDYPSDYLPPKTGYIDINETGLDLRIAYVPNVYVGQGAWSGTITFSSYTIADAWYRAETTAFESLSTFTGCSEGNDCFRGFIPVQGDTDDYLDANVWMMTSGGSDFDVTRTWGDNALWCSMQSNARIESVWESRQKAMEFAGLVTAWLKETNNLAQTENIEWCVLADLPDEPVISRTQGKNRERYWEQTINLEFTYKTETVF